MTNAKNRTIGLLYPGELGCALAKLCVEHGQHVVTTTAGRSERTQRLCNATELETLPNVADVVQTADVVLALVVPAAALEVARDFASVQAKLPQPRLYIDANSISPQTARQVAEVVTAAGGNFVDATVHGLAARLKTHGVMYLSGAEADAAAESFATVMNVRVLGDAPGQASAFKMLLGGMSKGLVSLFVEIALLAERHALFAALYDEYRHFYPGIVDVIERLLPTYPQHAARRSQELAQQVQTMHAAGLTSHVLAGAERTMAAFGALAFNMAAEKNAAQGWAVDEVVKALHTHGLLAASPADVPQSLAG